MTLLSRALLTTHYFYCGSTRLLALHSHMTSVLELHQEWMRGLETAQVSTCQ